MKDGSQSRIDPDNFGVDTDKKNQAHLGGFYLQYEYELMQIQIRIWIKRI